MDARTYYEITEDNEWEGETWHFFVPLTPAEASALRTYVEAAGPNYNMSEAPVSDEDIETLTSRPGNTTYLPEYSRCEILDQAIPAFFDSDNDLLYKGGLFRQIKGSPLPPLD
jgi:hypothetical protein